jgi:hypothetical protein
MHPTHLDADGCRSAILDYRGRLRRLVALVRSAGRLDGAHPARTALADLRASLEADVRARTTLEGQAGMTGLEGRMLEPALRQARIALAFPVRAHGDEWLGHLQAADACFLVALQRLNASARHAPATAPGRGAKPRIASIRLP